MAMMATCKMFARKVLNYRRKGVGTELISGPLGFWIGRCDSSVIIDDTAIS